MTTFITRATEATKNQKRYAQPHAIMSRETAGSSCIVLAYVIFYHKAFCSAEAFSGDFLKNVSTRPFPPHDTMRV